MSERRIGMNSDEMEQFRRTIASETGPKEDDEAKVEDELHPSPSVCPRALYLATEIWRAIREIEGVKGLRLEIADCLWENQVIELPGKKAALRQERSLGR